VLETTDKMENNRILMTLIMAFSFVLRWRHRFLWCFDLRTSLWQRYQR